LENNKRGLKMAWKNKQQLRLIGNEFELIQGQFRVEGESWTTCYGMNWLNGYPKMYGRTEPLVIPEEIAHLIMENYDIKKNA